MKNIRWMPAALLGVVLVPAWAQTDEHAGHAAPAPAVMDHANHGAMKHDTAPQTPAPEGPRDPHAYSGGYDFSQFPMRHEGGAMQFGMLRIDRLEGVRADGNSSMAWEAQASYGGDLDRAVFKTEGGARSGDVGEASYELAWSHATSAFWNAQLGARYDGGAGPDRSWLSFGIQGLAPYWFEIDATFYLGDGGRTALSVETEYELLLTQKLILQPRVEAMLYGKDDAARGLDAGLSEVTTGLRLRHEITREFAPYLGVERTGGDASNQTRAVAGVRVWF